MLKCTLSITASLLLFWAGESFASSVTIAGGTGSTTAAVKSSALAGTEAGLVVRCASGCSGGSGGAAQADNSALTDITGMGALYDTSIPAITDGNVGIPVMDSSRRLIVNCGTGCSGGTQYTEDGASAGGESLTLMGGVRRDAAASSSTTDGDYSTLNLDASGKLWVQTGTVTIANTNMESYLSRLLSSALTSPSGGAAAATTGFIVGGRYLSTPPTLTNGQEVGLMFSSAGRLNVDVGTVTVASHAVTNAGTFATQAAQSGTWTVQPGNTANTTAWKVDGSAVTQPVSGTVTVTQGTGTNLHMVCDSGCSGGSQYAEDAAETAGANLTMAGSVRRDTAASSAGTTGDNATINTDATGRLWTRPTGAVTPAASFSNPTDAMTVWSLSGCYNGTTWDPCTKATAGAGAVDSGTQRITWASDAPGIKAEDAAHTTADPGMVTLSKRTDTAASSAGTDGDYATINTDSTGRVWTNTELPDAAALADATSNPTIPAVAAYNMCFNGTTWDRCAGTSTTHYLPSAASTNSTNVKNAAGTVSLIAAVNTTATIYYLRLYNSSSAPTCSSATNFVNTFPIPASTSGGGIVIPISIPVAFTTGISYCLTGGGSSTDNTNAATGVYLTMYYK